MRDHDHLPAILAFLDAIGIPAREGAVPADAFLPGVLIEAGGLVISAEACVCAGDVLHEAGHLAVLPAAVRPGIGGDVDACLSDLRAAHPDRAGDPAWTCVFSGGDTPAIAWSFAAAVAVGLPTRAIFIQEGYKASQGMDPQVLHDQVAHGFFPGIMHLVRAGLTDAPLMAPGPTAFPAMKCWVVG